ncbi:MAG TPA: DUF5131 family protein [Stellaceae bacterium]|nr:DUF5131 family protein [Stellaceae bacterium]
MDSSNPALSGMVRAFNIPWDPVGDGLSGRLGWPLSCPNPQRILVETRPDLFDASRPDETLDLVHAMIAVAHWHRFLVISAHAERMIAYYSDAETPRRIAEEIGMLSSAMLAEDRAGMREDWIAGLSRVRYGLRPCGGIGPIGLEHWPLPNLWAGFRAGEDGRIVPLPGLPSGPGAAAA